MLVVAPEGFPKAILLSRVGEGGANRLTLKSSMLILYDPPESLRISNRTFPDWLTVKVTLLSDVDEVVIVDPTLVHVLPLLVDL